MAARPMSPQISSEPDAEYGVFQIHYTILHINHFLTLQCRPNTTDIRLGAKVIIF